MWDRNEAEWTALTRTGSYHIWQEADLETAHWSRVDSADENWIVSHLTRGRPGNSTMKQSGQRWWEVDRITFDKRQIWKQHIAKAEAKARRKLAILRKLAGTTWGASEKILKTVYQGAVRPHLVVNHCKDQPTDPWQGPEPGTPSDHWCDAVHTDHRNGEAHRSPTSWSMQGCQENDAGRKVQMLDKPSHENQAGRSHQESAKKKQFCQWVQEASRQFHDRLPKGTLPFFPPDMSEPWVMDITDIKVHTTVPSLSDRDTQDDTVKQSCILAMIAVSTGSKDPCIHRWVSNERGDQRRGRYTGPLPRRTESLSKHDHRKALLQLPCRNRSPHTGCLHNAGFR